MSQPFRITSRDNQHLKFARSVRDGVDENHIFIEGRRLCYEAVKSEATIEMAFCSDEFLASDNQSILSLPNFDRTYLVSDALLRSIADTANPQGIVLLAKRPAQPDVESLFSGAAGSSAIPIRVFLEKINNPSNLGAIIRTAEAAGARGVIVSNRSADPFSAKSIRASMGSAFRLPIASGADLANTKKIAVEKGIRTIAVDTAGSEVYTAVDWCEPSLLVFGPEAAGLPDETISSLGNSVRIPVVSPVESLNLAVACAIVLFEARRQNTLSDR